MKRIILILILFAGIAKGQIVGGYLPINSSKSATVGALRVNGALTSTGLVTGGSFVTAGTLGVGGVATFSGGVSIKSESLVTGLTVSVDPTGNVFPFIVDAAGGGGNAELIGQGSTNSRVTLKNTTTNARWFLSNNTATTGIGLDGFSIGTSSDPNSGIIRVTNAGVVTLTNTTNKLGNTTLLSASTVTSTMPATSYTIANLNDVGFYIRFGHGSYSPAGGATTYYGENSSGTPQTVATYGAIPIFANCTLVGGGITVLCGGAGGAGSTTLSVRVDNTTNLTFLSTVTHSAATGVQTFSTTGLTSTISAGSYINIQQVTPSWSVAPTGVFTGGTLYFKYR